MSMEVSTEAPKQEIKMDRIAQEEFLTTKELMQLLKIKHRQTIYSLIDVGLPKIVVGRTYRFIKQEVITFLKNHPNTTGTAREAAQNPNPVA